MKCRLLRQLDKHPTGVWPVGSIIDDPEACLLVQHGVAEPADEECEKAHGMTPEQLQRARYCYERTSRGIQPEDFAAYDAGEMLGYNPDGSWIPGPNYVPPEDDEPEEGEDEEGEDEEA